MEGEINITEVETSEGKLSITVLGDYIRDGSIDPMIHNGLRVINYSRGRHVRCAHV